MKKKPLSRTTRRSPARRKLPGNMDRQLIFVDQAPLRHAATKACSEELARLDAARAEYHRFEREDKPAFQRWISVNFGPQLTLLRDGQMVLREKEALIHEVEIEHKAKGGSRRAAYKRVMRLRRTPSAQADQETTPPQQEEPDVEEPQEEAEFDEEIPRDERREMFEDFLRMFLKRDPAELSREEYERMFAEFQEDVFKSEQEQSAAHPANESQPTPPPARTRLKEIYRMLVRRLHPDLQTAADSAVPAIWHEVQEAYHAGNLERLEMLLALADIQAQTIGGHTSLFQIREVMAELRQGLQSLEKSLRAARKDPAWGFARSADNSGLQVKMGRKLKTDLVKQYRRLQESYAVIARWSRKRRGARLAGAVLQAEFGF